MEYPRLFARQKPAGRISSVAKLFLDPKSPKSPVVECILVDYSAGGACLQMQKFVQIPDRLEVLYGTTRKRCRVVWRRGLRFGVAF
jgi:PilZ domain-containing protein